MNPSLSRWALLDPSPEHEDFTLRQLRLTLERLGHEVRTIRLVRGKELKPPDEIAAVLRPFSPQRLVWTSTAALPYFDLWSGAPWRSVPKIVLWFDEPVTRVECIGLGEVMKRTAGRSDFLHGIWDGYWREEALRRWGIHSRPIHLAADEVEYRPPPSFVTHVSQEKIVFIGMLHSAESIAKLVEPLSRGLKALATAIRVRLDEAVRHSDMGWTSGEIPSWDILWRDAETELQPKERCLVPIECQREPLALCSMRYAAWAMAKNAVRIRILRKALAIAPLLVFTEQKHLGHAREAEWRGLLGEPGSHFRVVDTSGMNAERLGDLYHHGIIHIQATDPQSVRGGIPYRVFQTAASGRALLTDLRPELIGCFEPGKEILGYSSADDFARELSAALADPDRLNEIGRAARRRFEREHTWRHRLATMESWIAEGGSRKQPQNS
ncbi:MAG: glycosyltransferase family 1 protein [Verrucomicrobia bacterium]|nr:glycosyltransferase family 1 protein [Verrucomicrobiota bacterium]